RCRRRNGAEREEDAGIDANTRGTMDVAHVGGARQPAETHVDGDLSLGGVEQYGPRAGSGTRDHRDLSAAGERGCEYGLRSRRGWNADRNRADERGDAETGLHDGREVVESTAQRNSMPSARCAAMQAPARPTRVLADTRALPGRRTPPPTPSASPSASDADGSTARDRSHWRPSRSRARLRRSARRRPDRRGRRRAGARWQDRESAW